MKQLAPLLILPLLWAFNFSPMSQTIELDRSRKGAQFLVENDSASSMAVELSVKERRMDEKGEETLVDTKDISIFPPQIIIPPNEKRTIRVTYNSKEELTQEKNFRVIAEQLPLKVDAQTKDQAGIKMLMKYVAALYAAPPGTKSDVELVSYSRDNDHLIVVVKNKGARHQLLTNPVIKYLHQGKKDEIKGDDLKGLAGENVLAGHKRIFRLKTKKSIPKGAKVELKLHD